MDLSTPYTDAQLANVEHVLEQSIAQRLFMIMHEVCTKLHKEYQSDTWLQTHLQHVQKWTDKTKEKQVVEIFLQPYPQLILILETLLTIKWRRLHVVLKGFDFWMTENGLPTQPPDFMYRIIEPHIYLFRFLATFFHYLNREGNSLKIRDAVHHSLQYECQHCITLFTDQRLTIEACKKQHDAYTKKYAPLKTYVQHRTRWFNTPPPVTSKKNFDIVPKMEQLLAVVKELHKGTEESLTQTNFLQGEFQKTMGDHNREQIQVLQKTQHALVTQHQQTIEKLKELNQSIQRLSLPIAKSSAASTRKATPYVPPPPLPVQPPPQKKTSTAPTKTTQPRSLPLTLPMPGAGAAVGASVAVPIPSGLDEYDPNIDDNPDFQVPPDEEGDPTQEAIPEFDDQAIPAEPTPPPPKKQDPQALHKQLQNLVAQSKLSTASKSKSSKPKKDLVVDVVGAPTTARAKRASSTRNTTTTTTTAADRREEAGDDDDMDEEFKHLTR